MQSHRPEVNLNTRISYENLILLKFKVRKIVRFSISKIMPA